MLEASDYSYIDNMYPFLDAIIDICSRTHVKADITSCFTLFVDTINAFYS